MKHDDVEVQFFLKTLVELLDWSYRHGFQDAESGGGVVGTHEIELTCEAPNGQRRVITLKWIPGEPSKCSFDITISSTINHRTGFSVN